MPSSRNFYKELASGAIPLCVAAAAITFVIRNPSVLGDIGWIFAFIIIAVSDSLMLKAFPTLEYKGLRIAINVIFFFALFFLSLYVAGKFGYVGTDVQMEDHRGYY
jgi:hypothetical protein